MTTDTTTPRLSPSIAKHLIHANPAVAWADHRLLGGGLPVSPSKLARLEAGSILHDMLFEGGEKVRAPTEEDFVDKNGKEMKPWDGWTTKASQAWRDKQRADGFMPVLPDAWAAHELVVIATKKALGKHGIYLDEGVAEQRVEWDSNCTNGDLECSGQIDWLGPGPRGLTIVEYATLESVPTQGTVTRRVTDGAKVLQACAYPEALLTLGMAEPGRIDFLYVYAQTKPPYQVGIFRPTGMLRAVGEARWESAKNKWVTCLANDYWPGEDEEIQDLDAPKWLLDEAYLAEEASDDE